MRRTRSSLFVEHLEPRRLLSDVIAVGPEFRVNTFTTGAQTFPSIAADASGNFVVVWAGVGQDDSSGGVFAQRFSAAGLALGTEFRVNTYTTNIQGVPTVAMDADGDFVIAWSSKGQDGSYEGAYAQRFNAAGVPQGGEFQVNTYTTSNQFCDSIAMDANGDFVITWSSGYQDGSSFGVYAQRYNAAGEPQGGEFRVNTHTTSVQGPSDVAMDETGDFIITWSSYGGQDGSGGGVYAQRYDREGIPQGTEFRVNTYTTSTQAASSVAMDADGNFVIAWHSNGQDGSTYGVYAQRYSFAGVPQGGEFRVNTYTTNTQALSQVAMSADGDLVIAWGGEGVGDSGGVYARRYDSAGAPVGGEFRVNTNTTPFQGAAGVAMDRDGDFVISWRSDGQDGSGYGIYAQRYGVVPEVTASSFHFATAPHKLSFTFDRDVSGSLGTDDLVVQNLTTMQTIPSSDFLISYDTLTNVATFSYTGTTAGIAGMLPDGNYSATLVASGITTIQGAPLASNYVQNFQFLQGDADHDGRVNLNDFNILAANFGQSPRNFGQGDFNYDTIVNLNDFNLLAGRFGQVLAAPTNASSGLGGRSAPFGESRIGDEPDEVDVLLS